MSTNTFLGIGSLANNTGTNNSSVGYYSLFSNLDASSNIALGSNALLKNKTGAYNSAIGTGSMCFNQSGSLNTAVGSNALEGEQMNSSVGDSNVAVGAQALFSNSGNYSTAVGTYALMDNTTPVIPSPDIFSGNTAVGYASLQKNTTGFFNTASGVVSLNKNITGYQNVAIGAAALENNTTGFENTAIGAAALRNNTGGENNTAIGAAALEQNTSGTHNIALGTTSLRVNTIGNDNTALGYRTLRDNVSGSLNTAIGFQAGLNDINGSNNTYLGSNADMDVSGNTYTYSTAIGYGSKITDNNQIQIGRENTDYIKSNRMELKKGLKITEGLQGSAIEVSPGYNTTLGNLYVNGITGMTNNLTLTGGEITVTTGSVTAISFTTTSDYRIKANVENLTNQTVDNLRPVAYTNKLTGKQDIGLIAHELQEYYPELVCGEKDGEKTQSVNYIGLIGVLISEIQQLKRRVNKIENEIKSNME